MTPARPAPEARATDTAKFRPYDPATDFGRIRQFLVDTFALYGRPFNWLVDHWDFCRYFAVPVHTFYNMRYFGVPTLTHRPFRDELPAWEKTIGVWETPSGAIAGAIVTENEEPGEVWPQIHPDHTDLYPKMVDYAEDRLADRVGGVGFVKLFVNEGTELEAIAAARGYTKLADRRMVHLEHRVTGRERAGSLPQGFVIRSVAEEDDVEQRRMAKAIAFGGHFAPSDWPPASAFTEMQQAPGYRADLDLFVAAPNGDCAAFCTIWVDERNHYANFEPVGTRVDYQGQGLAPALLTEGFRRMARLGVTRSFMDSANPFYRKVGFRETPWAYGPWIKLFKV